MILFLNLFLGSRSDVFKWSPKDMEMNVEKVSSAKECAEACDDNQKCLLWEYNKKPKNCKISVFRSKTLNFSYFPEFINV